MPLVSLETYERHLTAQESFNLLRVRWGKLVNDPVALDAFDPQVRAFSLRINKHPDIVTIFSCDGHFKTPKVDGKPRAARGYVMFGVRDENLIQELYKRFYQLIEQPTSVSLRMTHAGSCLGRDIPKNQGVYAVWMLEWVSLNEQQQAQHHWALQHVADVVEYR